MRGSWPFWGCRRSVRSARQVWGHPVVWRAFARGARVQESIWACFSASRFWMDEGGRSSTWASCPAKRTTGGQDVLVRSACPAAIAAMQAPSACTQSGAVDVLTL